MRKGNLFFCARIANAARHTLNCSCIAFCTHPVISLKCPLWTVTIDRTKNLPSLGSKRQLPLQVRFSPACIGSRERCRHVPGFPTIRVLFPGRRDPDDGRLIDRPGVRIRATHVHTHTHPLRDSSTSTTEGYLQLHKYSQSRSHGTREIR